MTEAHWYLQETPREGSADLVARASVTRARAGSALAAGRGVALL